MHTALAAYQENCKVAGTLRCAVRQGSGKSLAAPLTQRLLSTTNVNIFRTPNVDRGRMSSASRLGFFRRLNWARRKTAPDYLADGTTECACYYSCRNRTLQFPCAAYR